MVLSLVIGMYLGRLLGLRCILEVQLSVWLSWETVSVVADLQVYRSRLDLVFGHILNVVH